MSSTAKAVVLAIVAVLVTGVAGAGVVWSLNQTEESTAPAPASVPAATGKPTPTAAPRSLSAVDLSDAVQAALTESETLLHNPLYAAGRVTVVDCPHPGGLLSTKQALLEYANAVVSCLVRAWKPVVARSGAELGPSVVHAITPGTPTPCGEMDSDAVAFYCSNGSGIYFDWDNYVAKNSRYQAGSVGAIRYTMAHEFGHHLQEVAGIMASYGDRYQRTEGAQRLEHTRRLELQASCFAAAFFGADQKTLELYGERLADFRWHAYSGDDDEPGTTPDHGSRKSNTYWSKAAFKARGPGACNTWAAPGGRVT
jgi:uncharacterized protein